MSIKIQCNHEELLKIKPFLGEYTMSHKLRCATKRCFLWWKLQPLMNTDALLLLDLNVQVEFRALLVASGTLEVHMLWCLEIHRSLFLVKLRDKVSNEFNCGLWVSREWEFEKRKKNREKKLSSKNRVAIWSLKGRRGGDRSQEEELNMKRTSAFHNFHRRILFFLSSNPPTFCLTHHAQPISKSRHPVTWKMVYLKFLM